MKVFWESGHEPMFEMSTEERALFIIGLRKIAETDKSEVLHRMLRTAEQIDMAMRIDTALKEGA